jgi:hypothetical protein
MIHRRDERVYERKIILAAFVHERPGHAFARDRDAQFPQNFVVLARVLPVLRFDAEVAPSLVFPEESRTLETGNEKCGENACFVSHEKSPFC